MTLGALGLAVLVGVFQVLDEYRRRLARLKMVRGAKAPEVSHIDVYKNIRYMYVYEYILCYLILYIILTIGQCHTSFSKLPCTPPTLSATFKNSKQSHTQQSKNPNN